MSRLLGRRFADDHDDDDDDIDNENEHDDEDFRRLIVLATAWTYELQSAFFSAFDLDQTYDALDGRTVLQYLCSSIATDADEALPPRQQREEQLRRLLDEDFAANVNINAQDCETGCTILHEAIFQRMSNAFVEFLLQRGADPNATNMDGHTPVHYAASFGDKGLLMLLLRAGGQCNAVAVEGLQPLHLAAMKSLTGEECEVLIAAGADVDAIDERGASPLVYAVRKRDHGRELCVATLLAQGATLPQSDCNQQDLRRRNSSLLLQKIH